MRMRWPNTQMNGFWGYATEDTKPMSDPKQNRIGLHCIQTLNKPRNEKQIFKVVVREHTRRPDSTVEIERVGCRKRREQSKICSS